MSARLTRSRPRHALPFVSVNACYRQFLAQASSQQDTDVIKTLRRSIPISAAIVVIVGVSWLGLRYFRSQIDCKKLSAAFARQVENIKEDAHERLKIGTKKADVARFFAEHSIPFTISEMVNGMLCSTKKADVARFFAEHSIPFTISESEAKGTLWTSGCAPFGCSSDSALIGVSVKLDPAGAVTEEPTVIGMYTDCL